MISIIHVNFLPARRRWSYVRLMLTAAMPVPAINIKSTGKVSHHHVKHVHLFKRQRALQSERPLSANRRSIIGVVSSCGTVNQRLCSSFVLLHEFILTVFDGFDPQRGGHAPLKAAISALRSPLVFDHFPASGKGSPSGIC
ncbi:hypothetical protein KCP69_09260 [Salmonella enterica subsp. enterica]|nr:hypothetical protein KCP69_09260 [Salmonella enterica subsp. enterica]